MHALVALPQQDGLFQAVRFFNGIVEATWEGRATGAI